MAKSTIDWRELANKHGTKREQLVQIVNGTLQGKFEKHDIGAWLSDIKPMPKAVGEFLLIYWGEAPANGQEYLRRIEEMINANQQNFIAAGYNKNKIGYLRGGRTPAKEQIVEIANIVHKPVYEIASLYHCFGWPIKRIWDAALKKHKLKTTEAAEYFGVAGPTVSNWVAGSALGNVNKKDVAEFLGISDTELRMLYGYPVVKLAADKPAKSVISDKKPATVIKAEPKTEIKPAAPVKTVKVEEPVLTETGTKCVTENELAEEMRLQGLIQNAIYAALYRVIEDPQEHKRIMLSLVNPQAIDAVIRDYPACRTPEILLLTIKFKNCIISRLSKC